MNRRLTRSFASMGAATLLFSGAATILASQAGADTPPPWEASGTKDTNEVGTLALYDASGNQVTTGSVTDAPIAKYMVGSTADTAHTKATAYLYTPKTGVAAGAWSGEQISLSTTYPVPAGAGVPVVVSSADGPVVTGGATDETIATYMGDFPNTDTSTPGYVDAFQLRVKTSTDGTYQSLDFVVSGITKDGDGTVTGGTWTQTYPGASPTATTTALAVSRTTATTADEVTLTATTGGGGTHPAGSVQFSDNGGNLGAAVAVNGSGVATLVQKLPAGSNVIKATFTPTDSSFASSSSSTKTVTVTKARINNLKHPKLKGKHKVGEPEKVKPGKWSPKPTKFKFKWYLDGKKIKGAKQKTYTPTKKDKGGKLSCKVTAKRAGYKSGKATTKAVKIKK